MKSEEREVTRKINILLKKSWVKTKIIKYFINQEGNKPACFNKAWINKEKYIKKNVNKKRPINKKKPKKYLQNRKECYFCKFKKVLEHHISYNPERIMYFCVPCHKKLHFVIDNYHQQITKKDLLIAKLENPDNFSDRNTTKSLTKSRKKSLKKSLKELEE